MKYKSPLHRALKAAVFSVPLLLGIYEEYQDITVDTLSYRVGSVPRIAVLEASSKSVQVSEGDLIVKVGRPSLSSFILKQYQVSFVVLTLLFWIGLMIGTTVFGVLVMKGIWIGREVLEWGLRPKVRVKKERIER